MEALEVPPGFVFDHAIATTYSLDLLALLSVPVHLAMLGRAAPSAPNLDTLAVLEGLQRTASNLTVFCERGGILAPGRGQGLFALLEPVIVEARAPMGGSFHAKLWCLRYRPVSESGPPLLRLIVPSRNLTHDCSWDMSLVLEGSPGGRNHSCNREISELIASLPRLAVRALPEETQRRIGALASEVRRVAWDLPEGFSNLDFHVFGIRPRRWPLGHSKRLAVISPFCGVEAIRRLSRTADHPVEFVSRQETLDSLGPDTRDLFESCMVLHGAAETDDREQETTGEGRVSVDASPLHGLHAKAYIAEVGSDCHVLVGSANATDAAVIACKNVEVMVELTGRRGRVGGIDALLGTEGMGPLLVPYMQTGEAPDDHDLLEAENALEEARRTIANADLRAVCEPRDGAWDIALATASEPLLSAGVATIKVWPATVHEERAIDGAPLLREGHLVISGLAAASVTGLIVFRLTAAKAATTLAFVLNVPVDGLPSDRDGAILAGAIRNRDDFLRYLLLLLAGTDDDSFLGGRPSVLAGLTSGWGAGGTGDFPLLEELVRAFGRSPERLQDVDKVVRKLETSSEGREILPPGFLELWSTFRSAMERRNLRAS